MAVSGGVSNTFDDYPHMVPRHRVFKGNNKAKAIAKIDIPEIAVVQ